MLLLLYVTSTLTAPILVVLFTAPARKGIQAMEKLAKEGENAFFYKVSKLIWREVRLLRRIKPDFCKVFHRKERDILSLLISLSTSSLLLTASSRKAIKCCASVVWQIEWIKSLPPHSAIELKGALFVPCFICARARSNPPQLFYLLSNSLVHFFFYI